jgi:hypothetical protein
MGVGVGHFAVRTGRAADLSTTRLAVVSTAQLAEHHPPPQVAGQLADFFR